MQFSNQLFFYQEENILTKTKLPLQLPLGSEISLFEFYWPIEPLAPDLAEPPACSRPPFAREQSLDGQSQHFASG